jgi:alpha-1,2-mannosyltransferase
MTLSSLIAEPNWINKNRITAYSIMLFLSIVSVLVYIALIQWGVLVPIDIPIPSGFSSFYSAGALAGQPDPARVYDLDSHKAMQQAIYGDNRISYYFYFYPPYLLLVLAPLAALPYLVAFYVWVIAQAALFFTGIRLIIGKTSLWPFIAFPAAAISFALGQNSLLTASLFAFGLLMRDRNQPFWAGFILGLLVYKPHFGILMPIAFVAGREWKMIGGAITSVVLLTVVTTLIFGPGIWPAYLHLFQSTAQDAFESGRVTYNGMISAFGSVLLAGGSKEAAYAVQAVFSLSAAALVFYLWQRTTNTAIRSMSLIAGTLLSMPVILFYDYLPAAVALAFLIPELRKTGWMKWEKALIVVIYMVALAGRPVAMAWNIPYGPTVGVILSGIAWRRYAALKPVTQEFYKD